MVIVMALRWAKDYQDGQDGQLDRWSWSRRSRKMRKMWQMLRIMHTQSWVEWGWSPPYNFRRREFAPGIRRQRLQTVLGRKILRMIHVPTGGKDDAWMWMLVEADFLKGWILTWLYLGDFSRTAVEWKGIKRKIENFKRCFRALPFWWAGGWRLVRG